MIPDSEELREEVAEWNPDALLADGFDDAFIGMACRCGMEPVVAYDFDLMVEVLMKRDGMTWEEAVEYLDFNVLGTFVGENGPLYIRGL